MATKRPAGDRIVVKPRPKVIDRFVRLNEMKKRISHKLEKMKMEVQKILRITSFDDAKMNVSYPPKVDGEKAIKWLRKQYKLGDISKEEYEKMFVRVFDEREFSRLIFSRKSLRSKMPSDIITYPKRETLSTKSL